MPKTSPVNAEEPDWKTAKVVLPKLGGLVPEFYVPFLFWTVLALATFFLTLYPGVAFPGARVRVESEPPGAAVFFGGRAYGFTPVEAFVPAGEVDFELSRPGFTPHRERVLIGNNPFLSLFFPARQEFRVHLANGDLQILLQRFEAQLSEVALATPYEENRLPPPLFSDLRADLAACGVNNEEFQRLMKDYLPYVADPYLYRDLRKALSGHEPGSFEDELAFWQPLVDTPTLPLWVWVNSLASRRQSLAQQPFFASLAARRIEGNRRRPLASRRVGFLELPLGLWLAGPIDSALPEREPFDLPYRVAARRVLIQARPVTQREFARFLSAHPEWAAENRSELIQKGLVDGRYLDGWQGLTPPQPDAPVVNVSAYAVEAYMKSLVLERGERARLPFDHEWEAVANTNPGLFEWMANAYRSTEFLLLKEDQVWKEAPAGVVRSVRSPPNSAHAVRSPYQRGALPPEWCSPHLTFRVVVEIP